MKQTQSQPTLIPMSACHCLYSPAEVSLPSVISPYHCQCLPVYRHLLEGLADALVSWEPGNAGYLGAKGRVVKASKGSCGNELAEADSSVAKGLAAPLVSDIVDTAAIASKFLPDTSHIVLPKAEVALSIS
jgi:hypothetical protein